MFEGLPILSLLDASPDRKIVPLVYHVLQRVDHASGRCSQDICSLSLHIFKIMSREERCSCWCVATHTTVMVTLHNDPVFIEQIFCRNCVAEIEHISIDALLKCSIWPFFPVKEINRTTSQLRVFFFRQSSKRDTTTGNNCIPLAFSALIR